MNKLRVARRLLRLARYILSNGKWEAPSGERKYWRRKRPDGSYEYREGTPPGEKTTKTEEKPEKVPMSKVQSDLKGAVSRAMMRGKFEDAPSIRHSVNKAIDSGTDAKAISDFAEKAQKSAEKSRDELKKQKPNHPDVGSHDMAAKAWGKIKDMVADKMKKSEKVEEAVKRVTEKRVASELLVLARDLIDG